MVEVVGGKFSLACVLLGCVVLLGYFSDMVCPSSFSTRPTASFKISCPAVQVFVCSVENYRGRFLDSTSRITFMYYIVVHVPRGTTGSSTT